uniref:hypothetical protein n=1 Tax=Citrobacter freundii TaxID=546 RepID=UPI001E28E7C6|nr:hypothetical protein [Citrobacter freundii]
MTTTNHPAHCPVSLERLHQIREILSKAAAQSDGGNLGYAMADAVKVIDWAIAAIGAEPVAVNDDMAYAFHHALSDSSLGADEVEEIKTGLRAAFANVTAQPSPEVPDTLPCPVHLEPGLKFGKGVPTRLVLGALRRRADYYAELEAMTPEQRAEHDTWIAEFKAMLGNGSRGDMVDNDQQHTIQTAPTLDTDGKSAFPQHAMQSFGNSEQLDEVGSWNNHMNTPTAQAGNSPLTPDGWQLVPKEPTEAMNKAGWAAINEHDAINPTYRAMLAAAPQQEVKLALEHGMQRYAGAMQKLADAGD